MMSFFLLVQYNKVGFQEAASIIGMVRAKVGREGGLANASAFVHTHVLAARHRLVPSGAKYKGKGGYEAGDPRLENR